MLSAYICFHPLTSAVQENPIVYNISRGEFDRQSLIPIQDIDLPIPINPIEDKKSMSEQALISESPATAASAPETRIGNEMVEFLSVIQQTPREYWPNLLKMMRLFLETVTVKPGLSEPAETPENVDFTKLSKEERIKRNQPAIELLRSWREDEDDEQEQKETAEYLEQVINEDRMSNRPLFP
jgi:hypothetical protein